ncbi:MAG: APC family permease [Clostridia bacterium]|nr:APC family permease [Clostridia bacterium]
MKLKEKISAQKKVPEKELSKHESKKLGELTSTSICGNDISSSCLYVAGISIVFAGCLAPIALLIVAVLLFFYRKIYAEVGSALPLNGGAYNCLLNTTSKFKASIAACMSLLSYIATAVISGMTAVSYLMTIVDSNMLNKIYGTIIVLAIFAILTIIGIGESAVVATVIFVFHIITLAVFVIFSIVYVPQHLDIFQQNWNIPSTNDLMKGLFFGFSAALLGISGFESSANFIEEQKPGVFVKTLRNMWVTVSIFNPLIAFLCLGIMPIKLIDENKDYLLSSAAGSMGLGWLKYLITIDATLVLSGAVLTSFIGVIGLVKRMALDRCLPQFLLRTGKRNTNYLIILAFFLLCTSIIVLTNGDLLTLAGVYTISFLGVMSLFAIGNMLLKAKRDKLKRSYYASWPRVVFAFILTVAGIVGNILLEPKYLQYFLIYFVPAITLVIIMFVRIRILKFALSVVRYISDYFNKINHKVARYIIHKIDQIRDLKIIYFTNGDTRSDLIKVMLYVKNNELTKSIKFIHVYDKVTNIPEDLEADIKWVDDAFPKIKVDFELVQGSFGPEIIEMISKKYGVPKNYMFIGTPGEHIPYSMEHFGEVRLII